MGDRKLPNNSNPRLSGPCPALSHKRDSYILHPLIYSVFPENLLCDSLYSCPGATGENRKNRPHVCPPGTSSLVEGQTTIRKLKRVTQRREVLLEAAVERAPRLCSFCLWLPRESGPTSPESRRGPGGETGPGSLLRPRLDICLRGEGRAAQGGSPPDTEVSPGPCPHASLLPVSAAVCQPPCQNRGSCSRPQLCVCRSGFRGARCEEVIPEEEFDPQGSRPAPRRSAQGSPNLRRSSAAGESTAARTRPPAPRLPPAR